MLLIAAYLSTVQRPSEVYSSTSWLILSSTIVLLPLTQVAAMTVVDLAGKHCEEVVVCAHVRPDWPHTDPKLLCLEATLLVLEDPAAAEEGERALRRAHVCMTLQGLAC